ncbi:MAG: DUF1700 domain-containing protein [Clostridia bacterium]|nr:DUF1700 domain-containing protein [Clostridia bacterium]
MTKHEFLSELRRRIDQLPTQDKQKSLDFYAEIIDDRMELGGMTEEEAVAAMGPFDEITEQILMDIPLPRLVKARLRPTRALRAWEIVLLILGSPVWLPLSIAAAAVIFSVYAVFWSVVLTFYAVDLTFAISAVASLPTAILLFCTGEPLFGLFFLGAMLILGGLTIGWFFLCNYATKGTWWLCKKTMLGIKSLFIRKENNA